MLPASTAAPGAIATVIVASSEEGVTENVNVLPSILGTKLPATSVAPVIESAEAPNWKTGSEKTNVKGNGLILVGVDPVLKTMLAVGATVSAKKLPIVVVAVGLAALSTTTPASAME